MIRSFNDLALSAPMLDAVTQAQYETPTPIQARAIPPALAGRDLIGCAQTGTGKTAAFAIPIIERLCASRPAAGARALVLAPTRELALQIAQTFAMLGGARGIRTVTLIGGEAMGPQLTSLARRPDVITTFQMLRRSSSSPMVIVFGWALGASPPVWPSPPRTPAPVQPTVRKTARTSASR
jgi:superfamily II DNA/RNA helicase